MFRMKKMRPFLVATVFLCLGVLAQENEQTEKEETVEGTDIVVQQVVTASRKPEKRLESPATIEIVDATAIFQAPATAFSGALAQVKGIDFANGGINLQKISTRGFSSSYNSRMLTMVDGKLSTLPGAGLPQGGLSSVSPLDIKAMELVLGPAGALYGPNTTAGVLNILTKDPWDEDGFSAALKGGEQSLVDAQIRMAKQFDNRWGFKLTAHYLDADEFSSQNVFDYLGQNQTSYGSESAIEEAIASGLAYHEEDLVDDFTVTSSKFELTGYYKGDYATLSLNYGWSENDGFGVTNLGRNRIEGWEIETFQFRASAPHWFFSVSRTEEDAGDTYSIQNVPGGLVQGLTLDQAQEAAKFIDKSSLTDYEFQANWQWQDLEIIGGASYREYDPSSEGSFLDDIPDASGNLNDISRDETGLYVQLDYRALKDRLRFVAAGRYDDFSEFESQFSPKFGMTYQAGNHHLRANYMTSYRAPEIIETHLYFFGGIARGNLNGYTIIDPTGTVLSEVSPLEPEEVETFELGYRGIFGENFLFEAVAYNSDYDNFISPLVLVANGATAFAVNPENDPISPGGLNPLLFTYLNYGKAEIEGFDLGFDWYYDHLTIKASVGYANLKTFENTTSIPDIPFNTPEMKYKAQFTWTDIPWENTFFTAGGRKNNTYDYLSGRWAGTLKDTFFMDVAAGYTIPSQQMTFKLSWTNALHSEKTELLGAPASPSFVTFEISKKF